MSIYTDLLDAVSNGKKFKIDLMNKSLWIGKRKIIEKGKIVDEQNKGKDLIEVNDLSAGFICVRDLSYEPWWFIEFIYDAYKHSVPRENSNNRSYLKALSVDELSDADLAYNDDRNYMQALLEGYILLASINKWLKWEYGEHWFYQSKADPDLVILKSWIE